MGGGQPHREGVNPIEDADHVAEDTGMAGVADPGAAASPVVSAGLGGAPDGTQVPHRSPTAVPGKPMAPIADGPGGNSPLAEQAMDRGSGGQAADPSEDFERVDTEPLAGDRS
ncbi:MAG: hypothetical protein M3462_05925 [Chloroflexota bacterium]|nr:hypothetical protein [Chloroflexota bacterium]